MREETAEWLIPLMEAANERAIDTTPLMRASTMPAVEAASPKIDGLASLMPEGAELRAIDWVRYGRLLRHELGWESTYPEHPLSEYFKRSWNRAVELGYARMRIVDGEPMYQWTELARKHGWANMPDGENPPAQGEKE